MHDVLTRLEVGRLLGPKGPAIGFTRRRTLGNTLTSVGRFCRARYRIDRGQSWSTFELHRRAADPSRGRSCHDALLQPDEISPQSRAARPPWCALAVPSSFNLSVGRRFRQQPEAAQIVFV